jgi:hypothetical protein
VSTQLKGVVTHTFFIPAESSFLLESRSFLFQNWYNQERNWTDIFFQGEHFLMNLLGLLILFRMSVPGADPQALNNLVFWHVQDFAK